MQNYRKWAKDDGYIKNQNISLKNTRIAILIKISAVVLPLAIWLVFYAGLVLSIPSPDKGQHKDIIYSDITSALFHLKVYISIMG